MKNFFLLVTLLVISVGSMMASSTPPPMAAYLSTDGGVTWAANSAASGLGSLPFTPPAIGLYCSADGGTTWTPCTGGGGGGGGTPGGTSGQIQYNNAGSFGGFTMSGDVSVNTATGVATVATLPQSRVTNLVSDLAGKVPTSVPMGFGYTFYLSGGVYYARNNATNVIDYSGSDAGVVIRSAIANNAAICGHLFFMPAIYNINSLVAETAVGFNATTGLVVGSGTTIDYAIGFPATGASSNQVCQWIIEGDSAPPILFSPLSGNTQGININGVIFNITSTAIASVTAGNMIVGLWQRPQVSAGMNYEAGFVTAKNFGVRFPDNTRGNEEAIDFSMADYVKIENAVIDTNVLMDALAYPTVGTLGMYGIASTRGGQAGTVIDDVFVIGYGTAFDVRGENSIIKNSWALSSGDCMIVGARTTGLSGFPYHANHFDHLSCAETKYGVTLAGSLQTGTQEEFTALDFEDATSTWQIPFQPVRHMTETNSGTSWGRVSYSRTVGGVGNTVLTNLFDGGGGILFTTCGMTGTCATSSATVVDSDSFAGTASSALTSHTDNFGNTWALYSAQGLSTTPALLDGAGKVYGAGSGTNYITVLNSYAGATANYTVSIACTPQTLLTSVQLFARSSSGAYTNYLATYDESVPGVKLFKVVAGSATQLGTTYTTTWTAGSTHTLALTVGTNVQTVKVDGVTVSGPQGTDTAITAIGQAGFNALANNTMKISNYVVTVP